MFSGHDYQEEAEQRPRRMVVGDIYPCATPQMKRQDDLRKIWMWYAAQASGEGIK